MERLDVDVEAVLIDKIRDASFVHLKPFIDMNGKINCHCLGMVGCETVIIWTRKRESYGSYSQVKFNVRKRHNKKNELHLLELQHLQNSLHADALLHHINGH